MHRLSAWLALVVVAVVLLGGSAWGWTQVSAEEMLSLRSMSIGEPNVDGFPTQPMLFPFSCHL
jgi:hypothetical protein